MLYLKLYLDFADMLRYHHAVADARLLGGGGGVDHGDLG